MKNQKLAVIFLFILVFGLFSFFRFYNLDKRMIFDWDQEHFSYKAKQLIVQHKPILIDSRVISETGFFLAPSLFYLSAPFYLLTNLHPFALVIFIIVFQIGFFVITFLVLRKINSIAVALLFLFFWSINFLLVIYDTTHWGPLPIPLGVMLTWYLLYKLHQTSKPLYTFLLGITLGFFLNIHFQFVLVVFFSLFFLVVHPKRKIFFQPKRLAVFVASFLIMFLPLVIFDLRHDFLNSKLLLGFLQRGGVDSESKYFYAWLPVFGNFLQPLTGLNHVLVTHLFYFFILISLFFLWKKEQGFCRTFYLSSLVLWLVFVAVFLIYGRRGSEYYFHFLSPFIYFTLAQLILKAKKPFILTGVIIFFLIVNVGYLRDNLADNRLSLYFKDKVAQEIKKYADKNALNIAYSVPLGLNVGYQYLFDYYGIKQSGKSSDPLVLIKIPAHGASFQIGAIGVVLAPEFQKQSNLQK